MIYPMVILGALAIVIGFIVNPFDLLFIENMLLHISVDNYEVFNGDKTKIYKAEGRQSLIYLLL